MRCANSLRAFSRCSSSSSSKSDPSSAKNPLRDSSSTVLLPLLPPPILGERLVLLLATWNSFVARAEIDCDEAMKDETNGWLGVENTLVVVALRKVSIM